MVTKGRKTTASAIDDAFDDPIPDRAPEATADSGMVNDEDESVGKIVGKNRPTPVGRKTPTDSPTISPTNAATLFGSDRRNYVLGRKLHLRQQAAQRNLTLRAFIDDAIRELADREGMASQPGKVVDYLLEHAFRELAPEVIKAAYERRCDEIGAKSDWA